MEKGLKDKSNEERPRSVGLFTLEKAEGGPHSRFIFLLGAVEMLISCPW